MADTQKTVTITTQWKDDGLGNMSREVKKTGDSFTELRNQIKSADGTITSTVTKMSTGTSRLGKHFADLKNSISNVNNSVKGMSQGFGSVLKAFIGLEAAKKVIRGLVDSVKEFDKASGGNNVKQLQQGLGQLQIEMGSVLMPALKELLTWFKANQDQIMMVARALTQGLVSAIKIAYNFVNYMKDGIIGLSLAMAAAFYNAISDIKNGIADLLQAIPGNLIPEGWITSLRNGAEEAKRFGKVFEGSMIESADKAQTSLDNIKGDWKNLTDLFQGKNVPKASGIVFKSEEEAKKEKDRIAAIKELSQASLTELKAAQEKYTLASLDGVQKTLAENDYAYQKELENVNNLRTKTQESTLLSAKDKEAILRNLSLAEVELAKNNQQRISNINKDEAEKRSKEEQQILEKKNQVYFALEDIRIATITDKFKKEIEANKLAQAQKTLDLKAQLDEGLMTKEQYEAAITELEIYYSEQRKQIAKDEADYKIEQVNAGFEMASQIGEQIASISRSFTTMEIANIDKDTQKRKEAAKASIKNKEQLQNKYDEIDKEAEKKKKEAAKRDAVIAMVMAAINTAVAVTKALSSASPPVNFILAALTAAAGAAEIAVIASQNFASGGIVTGQGFKDSQTARLSPGEMVLTTQQQQRLFDMVSGRTNGGSGSPISINENIVVQGNLDMAAADKIRMDREKQLSKLKDDLKELKYRGQLVAA